MKPGLILLFFLLSIRSYAADFIVTSNADSGPGTLREAIVLSSANGSAAHDNILFSIPDQSVAGRTIYISSPLPPLSSNLTIDGTSQPGLRFGVTDAKIRITSAPGTTAGYALMLFEISDVDIYGLHFERLFHTTDVSRYDGIGMYIKKCTDINVGAAGKGNYFTYLAWGISSYLPNSAGGYLVNFSYKGNIVNLTEDGTSQLTHSSGVAMSLRNVKNFEIGGDLPGESNHMVNYQPTVINIINDSSMQRGINYGYGRVINNRMGSNFAGTRSFKCGSIFLESHNAMSRYTDTFDIQVYRNWYDCASNVGSNSLQGFLQVSSFKGFIDIKANRVGLLSGLPLIFGSSIGTAISIGGCEDGIIGGDNPADTNYVVGAFGNAIVVGNSRVVRITKNSLWCNSNGIVVHSPAVTVPKTKIFVITDHLVQGTTLPGSTVEVFLTRKCAGCKNAELYLGKTIADASGNWSFTSTVLLDGAVTATGTSPQGVTGELAIPEYDITRMTYTNPTCGQNNGRIQGMAFVAGTRYYWIRMHTTGVDTIFTENPGGLGPGIYRFVVEQGRYCSVMTTITLYDVTPKINSSFRILMHPSCGRNNGRILQHTASGSYNRVIWKNANHQVVGNTLDLQNVGAGMYKLIVLDTTYGCGDSTAFYTLINQSGPELVTSPVQVNHATCNNSNGSITGLTANNVTGTPVVRWVNAAGAVVGNSLNLTGVPAGIYRMKFKDASTCDTLISPDYTIQNQGVVTIDTTGMVIRPSSCNGSTGGISQITVTNADTYQWIQLPSGTVVGTAPDLAGMVPGSYQLLAISSSGCRRQSPVLTIGQASFQAIGPVNPAVQDGFCGQPNGWIRIPSFTNNPAFYSFDWRDGATGTLLATTTGLTNLDAGRYLLYATDSNGCRQQIFSASIRVTQPPQITGTPQVRSDECGQQKGEISGLQVSGLVGPTAYAWRNQSGQLVSTSLVLSGVGVGTYQLTVADSTNCVVSSSSLTVNNVDIGLVTPRYDDQAIVRFGTAALQVRNPQSGSYEMLSSLTPGQVLQQNTSGRFIVPNVPADITYFVRFRLGTCTSPAVPVKISVVDKSFFTIPSAFTPNGDGKNDRLSVKAIGYASLTYFRVYNRWGQLVYETTRFNNGWDGRVNGMLQETGTFVWMAEGVDILGRIGQEKGVFTLIR